MIEIYGWDLPTGIVEIHCPECGHVTMISEWQETTIGCEDCGDHSAIECPNCEERFDNVWHDELTEANP